MKNVFKITPEVSGTLKLKDSNTISYVLDDKLKVGQDYTITLSKSIKSFVGEALNDDIVYIVSAVPGAKVVKVLPEEKLEDLGKNLAVFFSIPIVNFTDLDTRDNLSCPLTIIPKVDGKCNWTTTSVLEFIPTKGFEGATKYDYLIKTSSGMNYDLENDFTGSFKTPELQVSLSDTFIPKNYINLNFNYPVSIEELSKNLKVLTPDVKDLTSSKGKWDELKVKVESVDKSENSFLIKHLTSEFTYSTYYEVRIKDGLKPKYGNISLSSEFVKTTTSTSLVSSVESYKNIYSDTGALVDTRNTTYLEYIPNKDVFFNLSFYEEMSLNKDMFIFKNDKTGKNINFDISYVKAEKKENGKIITYDNKNAIKLELSDKLENNTSYSLIISKEVNKSLLNDIVYTYTTFPELKITSFKFLDYSRSCLYVNNKLDKLTNESLNSWYAGYYTGGKNFVSFSNSGIVKSVADGQYIDDWNFEQSIRDLPFKEKNKKLLEKGYCPEAATGELLYSIDSRLSPNTTYDININDLVDVYGNNQKMSFKQTLKTGDLRELDKYVYMSFVNDVSVFPKSVPVILNIQTINTPKVLVELCQMDEKNYINYLRNRYTGDDYNPICNSSTTKTIDTKLVYWKLSNNKFDIEKDILGGKLSEDYTLVSVYSNINKSTATS